MKRKVCTGCGVEKPYDEYSRQINTKSGIGSKCKICVNERQRKRNKKIRGPFEISLLGRVNRLKKIKEHDLIAKHGVYVADILLDDYVYTEDVMKELNGY